MRVTMTHIYMLMMAVFIYVVVVIYFIHQTYGAKTNKSHWKLPRKIFILVSQPRSGSTYLGHVISQSINSMYLYEPLYRLDSHFGIDSNFANKSMRVKYEKFAASSLKNIFHCNFDERKELKRLYYSPFKALSKFSDCDFPKNRDAAHLTDVRNRKNHFVKFCLPYADPYSLQQDCHDNNLMVKFLEMRIPEANINKLANLIRSDVDYRVIYLVRDPRASLWSLHRQRWIAESFADDKFQTYIPKRCKEIENSIRKIHSNPNFLLIRYEDLVTRPRMITEKLKNFLDKSEAKKIFEKLEDNTCYVPPASLLQNLEDINNDKQPIDENELIVKTSDEVVEQENIIIEQETLTEKHRRKYQCSTINKWRMSTTLNFVNSVERHCSRVMKALGYKLIKNNYRKLKYVTKSLIESQFDINKVLK